MNQSNQIIGGGISDLLGHGDVYTPGAFDFAQKSEPVVRMAGGGLTEDQMLVDDFGIPAGSVYAAPPPSPVVPIAAKTVTPMGASVAAAVPSPVVSSFSARLEPDQPQPMLYGWEARKEELPQSVLDQLRALQSQQTSPQIPSSAGVTFVPEGSVPPSIAVGRTEQPPSFDELMGYVMSGQPTMKAAPTVEPAYTPAPSPVYTQAPATRSLFGMDVAQDQLGDLGLPVVPTAFVAPTATTSSPVQAPAPSTAAQTPAPAAKQGYTAYSGDFSPELTKLMPKSGADIGRGAWQFDTQSERDRAAYEAQYGGNAETGAAGGSGVNAGRPLVEMKEVQDENGNWISQPTNELDKRYGLTDTTGLVHGTQTVQIDPKHNRVTNAFFDPKTGKMVGQPIVGTYEIPKTNWIENLATAALYALPSIAIPGFGAGAALMSGAKSASEGNVLGALSGLAGGIGSLPGVDPSTVSTVRSVGDVASKISALTSGDPLQQLGALAGITGSDELATASKAANTVALLNAAASGNPNAVMKLVTTLGPSAVDLLTGGPGAMTTGEADERKGVSEVTDLINNLAFAPTPSPASAPAAAAPSPAPAPPSLDDLAKLYEPADATGMPPPPPPAPSPAPAPATSLEDELRAAGVDTGTEGTSTGTEGTSTGATQTLEDQLRAAGVDTGTEGTGTGKEGASTALSDDELNKFLEDIGTGGSATSTGSEDVDKIINELAGNKVSTLPEQAKFLESNVEDAGDIDQLMRDYAVDTGQIEGGYAGLGGLGEDYAVTDRGTVKSTYTGEEGTFDENGNWVPYKGTSTAAPSPAPSPSRAPAPAPVKKTTTPTTPTAAQSGLDFGSLLALMAMMGGGQQEPQEQVAYGQMPTRSVEEIFGLKEPTTLADILRRRV